MPGTHFFFLYHDTFLRNSVTLPPIQWVSGALSPGVSCRNVKLITHHRLVPRLRIRGVVPPLHQCVFRMWCLIK